MNEREYKPYGLVEPAGKCPIYKGSDARDSDLSGTRFLLRAPAGKRIELMGVTSLTEKGTLVIVEAKIGDDFIWGDSAIDPASLTGNPYLKMRIGLITEDVPLELFVQRQRDCQARLNLTFFGRESEMSTYDHAVAQRIRTGRQGLIHVPSFFAWVDRIKTGEVRDLYARLCRKAVGDYLAGYEPPEAVGKRRKVEMSDTVAAAVPSDPHRGVSPIVDADEIALSIVTNR